MEISLTKQQIQRRYTSSLKRFSESLIPEIEQYLFDSILYNIPEKCMNPEFVPAKKSDIQPDMAVAFFIKQPLYSASSEGKTFAYYWDQQIQMIIGSIILETAKAYCEKYREDLQKIYWGQDVKAKDFVDNFNGFPVAEKALHGFFSKHMSEKYAQKRLSEIINAISPEMQKILDNKKAIQAERMKIAKEYNGDYTEHQDEIQPKLKEIYTKYSPSTVTWTCPVFHLD